MQLMSWITTAVCLAGTVLNVKKMSACFTVWLIGNILWLIWDIHNGFTSRAVLDIVQGCMSIWGIRSWRSAEK